MSAPEEIHPEVAEETFVAMNDDPVGKAPEHFQSRRALFAEVDKLIRGRVREILPTITLEFKEKLDKDLGLDALRGRVQRITDGIRKDTDRLGERFEQAVSDRAEAVLAKIAGDLTDKTLEAFDERVQRIVAREVARQLRAIGEAVSRHPPKKKRKRAG